MIVVTAAYTKIEFFVKSYSWHVTEVLKNSIGS